MLILVGFALLCVAGWYGYVQFFTRGLETLPARVCDGAVERDLVVQALPPSRDARERAVNSSTSEDFTWNCRVVTSGDSVLWGQTHLSPVSKVDWVKGHNGRIVRAAVGDIEALAEIDTEEAAVYVPCTPRSELLRNSSPNYAVLTSMSVGGDTKAKGALLLQILTDIAYEQAKHAYGLAECQGHRDFPSELPRYQSDE
ncbi:hypothetical protein JS756_14465 [Streptomyces actuosus]|uniref:Uncharacterized protein n=1 Tax=Streptomyces actuosus TaxID=1885 RepID=A0ABS2VQE2_STRAS|nr:hypothetical protein [Streptomyces actuosus]MBN0045291.1 hypothetical protein [Streptomyces actuosus]